MSSTLSTQNRASRTAYDCAAVRAAVHAWSGCGELDYLAISLFGGAPASMRARLGVALINMGLVGLTKLLVSRTSRGVDVLLFARQAVPDPGIGGSGRVEFRHGELDRLPIEDGEVDAVVANLVLHHLADFEPVVAEVARVLRPGGVAVISDLRPHGEEWMREEMGDLRLGIDPAEVAKAFRAGLFETVEEIPVEDRYRMRSQGGRNVRLELFFVRARKSPENSGDRKAR